MDPIDLVMNQQQGDNLFSTILDDLATRMAQITTQNQTQTQTLKYQTMILPEHRSTLSCTAPTMTYGPK